jgi:cell wall-associated NlpC family hydrolase
MSDRRTRFATDRVAAEGLRGTVEAPEYVEPWPCRVDVPSAFLYAAPGGPRDREVLFGDHIDIIDEHDNWSFGRAAKDGYCGWIGTFDLGPDFRPTHAVRVRHSHLYPGPDMKLPPSLRLPFGASLEVEEQAGRWARTPKGWMHADHLRRLDDPLEDPVAVAEQFLGSPYLWAGNTGTGIDCSGLVQVACLSCGIACPGDTDQQQLALGFDIGDSADLGRGDLLFWKTHVAWVADTETILHATAFRMSVVYEPLRSAIERIEAQGEGPVTSRRRLATVT